MQTSVQIAFVALLAAFLATRFLARPAKFSPPPRTARAAAAFVKVDESAYAELVRRVRTAWQVESAKQRRAGIAALDSGLTLLSGENPPPDGYPLPENFASAPPQSAFAPARPAHDSVRPPSLAAAPEKPSPRKTPESASASTAFPREALLALPPDPDVLQNERK